MRRKNHIPRGLSALCAIALLAPVGSSKASGGNNEIYKTQAIAAAPNVTLSVFATGLNNPRGLKFGPDGNL